MKRKLLIPLLTFSLTFSSLSGFIAPAQVLAAVDDDDSEIEGPELDEEDEVLYLQINEIYELVWYEGDEGEEEKVSFDSSNKTVATVDSAGTITAKAAGTTKISMFYNKTFVAACSVRVLAPNEDPEKIPPMFIENGQTIKVKAKQEYQLQYDPGTTGAVITFKSSKTKIAMVDEEGEVEARKKKGKAVITMYADGIEIGKCTIKVVKK